MELPALSAVAVGSRRAARRRIAASLVAAGLLASQAVAAEAQTAGSVVAEQRSELVYKPTSERRAVGWTQSSASVLRVAQRQPEIRRLRRESPRSYLRAYTHGDRLWQVSLFAPRNERDEEIGQVVIDDPTGGVLETWTGFQVAWTMARGYPGAFGRKVNALYVWLPLLALFLLPFLRPPWRTLHLDLLVLCAFSVSYALFGAGRIGLSVPLAYPCLLYLLGRMLWLARERGRPGPFHVKRSLHLVTSPGFLGMAVIFLLGFRLGLNVAASNVIDVGFSGVIGADRLGDGDTLYGAFPDDNQRGDTYGPVNYLAYLPFEQLLPWSGSWDDLPAAHAAAVAFDLACAGLLWLLGRRARGAQLGLLLAYLWLAFPFTLLVSNSNANDSLVAALVLAALLVAGRPVARGSAVVTAGLTKFAPLALLPAFATFPADGEGEVRLRLASWKVFATIAGAIAAGTVLLLPALLGDGGLGTFLDRTIGFQADRGSPFSVWGYHELKLPQRIVEVAALALAVGVAFVPRRRDLISLAALSAAVLIAAQLAVTHWFYLYIVWFFPLVIFALLAPHAESEDRG